MSNLTIHTHRSIDQKSIFFSSLNEPILPRELTLYIVSFLIRDKSDFEKKSFGKYFLISKSFTHYYSTVFNENFLTVFAKSIFLKKDEFLSLSSPLEQLCKKDQKEQFKNCIQLYLKGNKALLEDMKYFLKFNYPIEKDKDSFVLFTLSLGLNLNKDEDEIFYPYVIALLRLLLEAGANPNEIDGKSTLLRILAITPLDAKFRDFQLELLKLLCSKGADPLKKFKTSLQKGLLSPYEYAQNSFNAAIPLLQEFISN